MLLKIKHGTKYEYSEPVFLEPHTIQLIPKNSHCHTKRESVVKIEPTPAGLSNNEEQNGVLTRVAWFDGKTSSLLIDSTAIVEVNEFNAFDFLVYPASASRLPLEYDEKTRIDLAPNLFKLSDSATIQAIIKDLGLIDFDTVSFLTNLTKKMPKQYEYEVREFGACQSPEVTFKNKKGSCRDIAFLFIAICRELGLASRFVSGYYYDIDSEESELHAWVEVYIPGGGWRGFDPTFGIVCAGYHVALAASYDPALTLPVLGTFRGSAQAKLSFNLTIEIIG